MADITAPWKESTKNHDMPWHVLLAAQPWKIGEHGEISAQECPFKDDWDDTFTSGKVPLIGTIHLPGMKDEQARIMAQHIEATPESIVEGMQEQAALESLETHDEPDTRPDFVKEIQEHRRKLLSVVCDDTPDQTAYEVREQIRWMDNLRISLSDSGKQVYAEWPTANIQDKGLQATPIDLISSPGVRKIPIK
jgi:hypothetical protein